MKFKYDSLTIEVGYEVIDIAEIKFSKDRFSAYLKTGWNSYRGNF